MRALHLLYLLLLLLALPACDTVEDEEQATEAVLGGTYVGSEMHQPNWRYEFVIPTTDSGSFDFSGTFTHTLPNAPSPIAFTGSGTFEAPDVDIEFSYPLGAGAVVMEAWTGTISADGRTLSLSGVQDPGLRMSMTRQ